jgi:hypothetical protein
MREQAKATLLRWKANPCAFVREVFGITPEAWQVEALQAIVNHDRIAVKSGHGVGKSAFESWVLLWWLSTRYPAKVACTAPTAHQLEDVLWGEVSKWHRRMPQALRSQIIVKSDRVELFGGTAEHFAVARTARRENPEAFQGFHSENMLFLVDEASGVDEMIFEVGKGAMSTVGAKTLMCANPTRRSGYFFEAFHLHRDHWHGITVSCLDSSMASPEFIKEMTDEYGEDSDIFRIRVLGEFPRASSTQFISADLVDSCSAYIPQGWEKQPKVLGVDVARFGDDKSVICKRQGRKVFPLLKFSQLDTMALADRVAEMIDDWKPDAVAIDGGGVGGGVIDRLKSLGYDVTEVQFGGRANNPQDYADRRSEMWDRLKAAMTDGIQIPNDSQLKDDLCGPDYVFNRRDKRFLETKDSMKKRGLKSPDCADSLALTYSIRVSAKDREESPMADEMFSFSESPLGWMAA